MIADSTRPTPVTLLDWKTRVQIARDAAAGIRVRSCVTCLDFVDVEYYCS